MQIPYIGITDFTSQKQVLEMSEIFLKHRLCTSRQLAVGVMMSYKTLNNIPSRWSGVFPAKESIAEIFSGRSPAYAQGAVMNTIHYADYENSADLLSQLKRVAEYGGPNLHAIQLDMTWPGPRAVYNFRKYFPKVKIILQIGPKAFEFLGSDPRGIISMVFSYGGCVDYVLLDKSAGKGQSLEWEGLLPFVKHLMRRVDLNVAVAGGLGPETLHLLGEIPNVCSDISIDAQAKLRPSGSSLDPIDWSMAGDYLKKALQVLS
ncbi:MAG: hypothetical protein WC250_00580 [Candidatus Paceibacterota bacterium]|jgi:phosphoribosylanthranilate isomerase